MISALTIAGALCSARAKLPSGSFSGAGGLAAQPTADGAGNVSWTYGTSTATKKGTGTHFVTCTLGGRSAAAQSDFTVS